MIPIITTAIIGIIVLITLIIIGGGIKIVQQSEVMVIERLGSFHRTLEHGIHFIVPFIDKPRAITLTRYLKTAEKRVSFREEETRIDRREMVMDFPGQSVITTDNVSITIDGALYFQIIDPKAAIYQIENLSLAVETIAKTTLRSVVGKMELDKLFESRTEVNNSILRAIEPSVEKWGVKIHNVEIQDITLPVEIQHSMNIQMTAERNRRATVTEADGKKYAAITEAEGHQKSVILAAEADKEASILRAEGEQKSIELVLSSLGEGADSQKMVVGYLLGQRYINMLPDMAKAGERVFVPYEASALIGSMSMMRQATDTPEEMGKRLSAAAMGSHAS